MEPKDEESFRKFLRSLKDHGYTFYNESTNSIYHKFLYGGPRPSATA